MNRPSSILFSSEFHVGYRYAFNGKETETTVNTGAYDFGARMYDGRLGRWWSVDALYFKRCGSSTYQFSGNNPISIVDRAGFENVIFLIVTDKGREEMLKNNSSPEQIVQVANEMFHGLQLNTRVVLVTKDISDFVMCQMDQHDAVAVIGGTAEESVEFIKKELDPEWAKTLEYSEDPFCGAQCENGALNPERGENNNVDCKNGDHHHGEVMVIAADAIEPMVKKIGVYQLPQPNDNAAGIKEKNAKTICEYFALLILHAAGHNSGLKHDGQDGHCPERTSNAIMASGDDMVEMSNTLVKNVGGFRGTASLNLDGANSTWNSQYREYITLRFGSEVAKDNRTQSSSNKLTPCN